MKKTFFIVLGVLLIGGGIFFNSLKQKPDVLSAHTVSGEKPTEIRGEIMPEKVDSPRTLTIPKIQVKASIEHVGMDTKGRMDIPKNADNVAWYRLGYKPGDKGSAVIAGHFDHANGAPAVFYRIQELTIGDKLITTDSTGSSQTFAVRRVEKYPYDNFPLQEVFGSSGKPMLNLITCEGAWNSAMKNYSHRTVIYAELVP